MLNEDLSKLMRGLQTSSVMDQLSKAMIERSKIDSQLSRPDVFSSLNKVFLPFNQSAAILALSDVNTAMEKFKVLNPVPMSVENLMKVTKGLEWTNEVNSAFLRAHDFSRLAEKTLMKMNNLGDRFNLDMRTSRHLTSSFISLSRSYSNVFEELKTGFIPNPLLLAFTSKSYLDTTRLFRSISIDKNNEFEEVEVERIQPYDINLTLRTVDPSWEQKWIGALHALDPKNPERVRHFCVSTRQLLNEILQRFAPKSDFNKWNKSADPSLKYNKGPSRKGQIFYIYRNKDFGPLTAYIDQDVKVYNEFVELLNGQTHAAVLDMTDDILEKTQFKAERLMIQFIEAGHSA